MKYSVTETVLKTGTRGLLIDVPGSEVVQVKLYFRGGFQFGDFKKFEVPHVLEHLLLSSSKTYPGRNQLIAEFMKNGAQSNAHTTKDLLVYWFQAPDIDYERALKLFSLGITEPIFPSDALIAEIGNVSSELTAKHSQNSMQPGLLSLPANFPWNYIPMQERIDQLSEITIADVEGYFRRTHTAANGGFIVSGNIQRFRTQTLDALEKLYGQLPRGTQFEFNQSPGRGQPEPIIAPKHAGAEFYRLEWFADGGDVAEGAAYDILSSVLSGGWDSRIFGHLRNTGASYGTYTGYDHSLSSSHFLVSGQANPDRVAEVMTVVAEEGAKLLSDLVLEAEIAQAITRIEGSLKVSIQTPAALSSWYQEDYIFNQHVQSQQDYFDLLRGVTPQDVQRAARKIFSSPLHSSAYAGPVSKLDIQGAEKPLAPIWK